MCGPVDAVFLESDSHALEVYSSSTVPVFARVRVKCNTKKIIFLQAKKPTQAAVLSLDRLQIRQQVRHGRHVDEFLQALRHERQPRAPQLVDVNPQDRLRGAVGTTDREAVGSLRGNHSRKGAAGVRHQHVAVKLRLHLAIGVEDVEQDRFRALVAHGVQVGADLGADAFELVAGGALFFEDCFTANAIPLETEGILIRGDNVLSPG